MKRTGFLRTTAPAAGRGPDAPAGAVLEWQLPGRLAAGDPELVEVAGGWSQKSRYHRLAEVESVVALTPTGTVRIAFRVVDDEPFDHLPGQFVGVQLGIDGVGYARSPYCILSPPSDDRRFELLVRVVRTGPVSRYLGSCRPGEQVTFRAPTGRSMLPKDDERDLVLMGTGVGISPLYALSSFLLERGFERDVTLFWGLRRADDVCLTEELDGLTARYPNFSYDITLSQPPAGWPGLRGRITESVPPLLEKLGGTRYYLSGNGAMCEEMATALSDLGVADGLLYLEHYFNQKHVPDRAVLDGIRARFVASDLFSPVAHQAAHAGLFHLDAPLGTAGGNADPTAPTDVGRRMPKVVERIRSTQG